MILTTAETYQASQYSGCRYCQMCIFQKSVAAAEIL